MPVAHKGPARAGHFGACFRPRGESQDLRSQIAGVAVGKEMPAVLQAEPFDGLFRGADDQPPPAIASSTLMRVPPP